VRHAPAELNGDGLLDMNIPLRANDAGFSCNDIPAGEEEFTLPGILKDIANGTTIAASDNLKLIGGQ